jgi:hypothetical protein
MLGQELLPPQRPLLVVLGLSDTRWLDTTETVRYCGGTDHSPGRRTGVRSREIVEARGVEY